MNIETLIDMLYPTMETDRKIGHNEAIIKLLKDNLQKKSTDKLVEILKRGFEAAGIKYSFDLLRDDMIDELKLFESNNKLMFVKRLKEMVGCGLKEGKDVADYYFNNH